jgi:hypothetical protein
MKKTLVLALVSVLCAPPTGAADIAFLASRPNPALTQPHRGAFLPTRAPRVDRPWAIAVWARGYLSDAASVFKWIGAAQEPRIVLSRPQRQVPDVQGEWSLPGLMAPPVPNRMLVVKDPDFAGAAEGLSRALAIADLRPRLKRLAMPWAQAEGFKYRIVYLDSLGATYGRQGGFNVVRPGVPDLFVKAKVPLALRRAAPVYFRGMTVRYLVEIAAESDLKDLVVSTRQEELDGVAITEFKTLGTLTLSKGERAALAGSTPLLSTRNAGVVNFEHTHLLAGVESEERLRVDAADAGLVDPPSF